MVFRGWRAHTTPSGHPYFFNHDSGQSQWEKPADLLSLEERLRGECNWREFRDPAHHGLRYYYNRATNKTSWFMPQEYRSLLEKLQQQVPSADFRLPPPLSLSAEQEREVFFDLLRDAQTQPGERYLQVLIRLDDDPRLEAVSVEHRLALFEDFQTAQQAQLQQQRQAANSAASEQVDGFHHQKYRYISLLKQLESDGHIDTKMSWHEALPILAAHPRFHVDSDFSEPLEREFLFEETMMIVHTQTKQQEEVRVGNLAKQLRSVLQEDADSPILTTSTWWKDFEQELRRRHPWSDELPLVERLGAFKRQMIQLEEAETRQRDESLRQVQQRARMNRSRFRTQLANDYEAGVIGAFSPWLPYYHSVVKTLPYFEEMVGQPGSDPRDLFLDFIEDVQSAFLQAPGVHQVLSRLWQDVIGASRCDQHNISGYLDRLRSALSSNNNDEQQVTEGLFRTFCEYQRQAVLSSRLHWIYLPDDNLFYLTHGNTAQPSEGDMITFEDGEITKR